VATALLVHEQCSGVLSATIEAVTVSANVVVGVVVNDDVVARSVESNPDSRIERHDVVPQSRAVGANEQQPVHAALRAICAHLGPMNVDEICGRTECAPLILPA